MSSQPFDPPVRAEPNKVTHTGKASLATRCAGLAVAIAVVATGVGPAYAAPLATEHPILLPGSTTPNPTNTPAVPHISTTTSPRSVVIQRPVATPAPTTLHGSFGSDCLHRKSAKPAELHQIRRHATKRVQRAHAHHFARATRPVD